jgi:hypothetical protein
MGIVFVTEVNGDVDEELDTVDCAVRVLGAMQERGFAVHQMLVWTPRYGFTEPCLMAEREAHQPRQRTEYANRLERHPPVRDLRARLAVGRRHTDTLPCM